ncbi:HAMP domain-containing sensor histidine kinase [Acidovorax sp.]|uniref:sensor histidine kinase n=1 Tax=Acidovorax sp. TaxID=1872122 RepID=UPI002ACE8E38|nr:HAMP domain-containing sensor histidine kinase [Acidovorax sp.]MDZ7865967.1 HAMP domain-containing sensor histidine kinase [Acidovorax sp.]
MFRRLPYRFQVPLGLVLAVLVSALLVSAVAAQIAARSARQEVLTTVRQAMVLLRAQARPLLAADDTWRAYTLLRDTAALLPGTERGQTRAAILDAKGRFLAGSDPSRLVTGVMALGESAHAKLALAANDIRARVEQAADDGALTLVEPIRSEDGGLLGFVYVEIDAPAFATDWVAVAQPAAIGALLAAALLVPAGWFLGERMGRPIAQIASCIAKIGRTDAAQLSAQVPVAKDPELNRIGDAVRRLLSELQVRQEAELRALSAERLAAVGRITAAVAHEINNPLAGLLTVAQTLRIHGAAEETRIRSIDLIDRGLKQIQTMTAALLPQARVEDRALLPGDINDVVTLVQPEAQRLGVQISLHLDISSAFRVPSAVVRQVMLNLLLNAIKAAGDGGLAHALVQSDAQVLRISIGNTGLRLTAADLETRVASEGGNDPRGFGLWICREIANRFGGGFHLVADSAAATELCFWIPNLNAHEQVTVTR